MTLPLSKEQIEAIQARAEKATPDQFGHLAIPFADVPALCQQALRAIELEAELKEAESQRDDREETILSITTRETALQSELTAARNALKEEREIVKWLERKPAEVHCDFKCGYGKHGNKDECHCGFADWEASRPSPQVKP